MDTFLYAYDYLYRKSGKFRPPDLLRQNVKEDRLGLKTGRDFMSTQLSLLRPSQSVEMNGF